MKKLTTEQFKDIVDTFENAGYDPGSYSGRGMYGARCLSVTCDNPCKTLLDVVEQFDVARSEEDSVSEFIYTLGTPRADCMGMSQVLYFPDIVWQDEALDEDESEEE
jgi:hypothetical protein